jgi:type I restriction enzyme S subunit
MSWEWIGATAPAVMVSDQGKKVQTKDILETGKYPVVDQGMMFIRGYCDDSDRVISVTEPIVLFGDHTRETKFIDFDFVVGADGVKLLQPVCIDPRFYFLVLRWLPLESRGYARHFKLLKAARIPLPPLGEQKRIVAKVDELMALCDRLALQQQERETRHAALARASLARFSDAPTPANLPFLFHPSYAIPPADLRKSLLTLAVQGKLVRQDPNDEPAEELLWKILGERERLVKTRRIRRLQIPPLEEEDEPFPIPQSWVWTCLGTIGDWGSGSTPPRGNHELYGGKITWLKSGELNDNQALVGSSETVTELALKTCTFRQNKPGDVLIAMYGATIGKLAILAEEAVTNQAVCGCTPFPGILNTFLFYYLLSRRDAFHAASEGGAQPNISKAKIVNSPFPLPPLSEQRRIVAKLEQLMALVGQLETQLDASVATGANLLSALVAEISG